MQYERIAQLVFGDVWAIMPGRLRVIQEIVLSRMAGEKLDDEEIAARIGAERRRAQSVQGRVAVLPLNGVIAPRMNAMTDVSGGTSAELFGQQFDALVADDSIGAIVIDVDSPGGAVHGIEELADKIRGARGKKPITAIANPLMVSAAFWIGAAADEVVITPSGEVGSVGAITSHTDVSAAEEQAGLKETIITSSKFKAEGHPFEPLTDEARAELQRRVDEYGATFESSLAKSRGVSRSVVSAKFGQGRVYGSTEALSRGMVDRVATLETVLQRLGVKAGSPGRTGALDIRQRRTAMRERNCMTIGRVSR